MQKVTTEAWLLPSVTKRGGGGLVEGALLTEVY